MADPLRERITPDRIAAKTRRLALSNEERLRDALENREERRLLGIARAGRDVCWTDEGEKEPLVTVRIATYNRPELLTERTLPTVLNQSYENLEILIIGDHCDDRTERAVRAISDGRVRFLNLPSQGIYPEHVRPRRLVAGSHPMNVGLTLARGKWIAPCDDDDEMTPDHVEVLLEHARRNRCEMVYSKSEHEPDPGKWEVIGSVPLEKGKIAHGSVIYTSGLRFMRHSNTSWKMNEPSDWNLWRRMKQIGVRIGFLDQITYVAYLGAVRRAALASRLKGQS